MIRPEDLDCVDVVRKVALGGYKWTDEAPSVLPAFVAEHDLGPFPGIPARLRDIVEMGGTGYHDRFGAMAIFQQVQRLLSPGWVMPVLGAEGPHTSTYIGDDLADGRVFTGHGGPANTGSWINGDDGKSLADPKLGL